MTIRTFLFFSSSKYCKEREWKSTAHLILITAKPLKMATPVNQPLVTVGHTFTETANSYDIILGHYSYNFATHVPWILATESHLVVRFMCKFNLPMLADIKGCIVFVSYCKWARTSFNSRTFCPINLHPFPHLWATDLNFLVATDSLMYLRSLFIDRVMNLLSN
jgi:hypothetical protein